MANKDFKARGWLRQRERADGMVWLWCYQRLRECDGEMVENSVRLGLVADIGDDAPCAWLKVAELGLVGRYINNPLSGKPTFGELCAAYVKEGLPFRKKDGRRKSKGTIETYEYHINNHILPRWNDVVAEEMKPIAIRNWLFDLHDGADYVWETCAKTAGIMSLIFTFVDHNEIYCVSNPLDRVTIPASEEDREDVKLLLPGQVFALLERLPFSVRVAVQLVACTGVRVSECLGLTWKHVEWATNRIQIQQVFRRGEVQKRTKTKASKAPVPMCEALAAVLNEWRQQTPYNRDEDFIFASLKLNGARPLWGQTLNADFVKPATVSLGLVAKGERFGWHCFRHSLSTWANDATKDITVSQTLLRHAKPNTTGRYTHGNFEKALDAQRQYMEQLLSAKSASEVTQVTSIGLASGWDSGGKKQQPLVSGCAVSR
jgi:integrase